MLKVNSLADNYSRFFSSGSIDSLLKFIQSFDLNKYEENLACISEIYKNLSSPSWGQDILMKSNGSSGGNVSYYFGSNPEIIPIVENLMLGISDRSELTIVNSSYPIYDTTRFLATQNDNGSRLLKIDFTSNKSVEFFLKNVKPGSVLQTQPHICRMMCLHEDIVKYIREESISVVSTCDDMLVDQRLIKTRDKVIDWKTGLNYYECEYKSKHFVPIWFEEHSRSFNLVNTTSKSGHEFSDIFRPLNFFDCRCGKVGCEIHFVSHFKFKPKSGDGGDIDSRKISELSTMIPNQFVHIQFVECAGVINLLYDSVLSNDLDLYFVNEIEAFFGKKVILRKNKCFRIGGYKMPFLWKTDSLKMNETINPMLCVTK